MSWQQKNIDCKPWADWMIKLQMQPYLRGTGTSLKNIYKKDRANVISHEN